MERFSITGFGALGLAHNSSGKAAYVRDLSQPKGVGNSLDGRIDSRLGLQATLQVVSRYS